MKRPQIIIQNTSSNAKSNVTIYNSTNNSLTNIIYNTTPNVKSISYKPKIRVDDIDFYSCIVNNMYKGTININSKYQELLQEYHDIKNKPPLISAQNFELMSASLKWYDDFNDIISRLLLCNIDTNFSNILKGEQKQINTYIKQLEIHWSQIHQCSYYDMLVKRIS